MILHYTELWHRTLAPINERDLISIHKHVWGSSPSRTTNTVCRACRLGEAHKLLFPGQGVPAGPGGDIDHSDIMGPMVTSPRNGLRYVSNVLEYHSPYLKIGYMAPRSMLSIVFEKASETFPRLGGVEMSYILSHGSKE